MLAVPPKATALAGWALLPLRAFLGITFTFAGLQKIANPSFFSKTSTSGIFSQMLHAKSTSPIGFLLGHLLEHSTQLGWLIALGEVAVGVGTLLGLWSRLAALGGLVLSASLFLAVSFNTSPYYLGSDIVFCFAWLPIVLAGSPVLSIDAWIARRAAKADVDLVAVTFTTIQRVCGNFQGGSCTAQGGDCSSQGCPFLEADHPGVLQRRSLDDADRRRLVLGGVAVGAAAAGTVAIAGVTAGVGRAFAPASTASGPVPLKPTGGGSSALGTNVGLASKVPVGGSATFTVPDGSGATGLVVQPTAGEFKAFNSTCPHAGCPVSLYQGMFVCPCHGSEFNESDGAVIQGPAATGLVEYQVTEGPDGNLYVKV